MANQANAISMQIYVHRNNQQLGPFSEIELQGMINSGTLSYHDPVWWQGQATWLPLSQTSLASKLTPPPGVGVPPPSLHVGVVKTSNLALWSMICGVTSFFCAITFIPAIILGHMGLSETKKNPALQGRGMAIAGLIMGYLYAVIFMAIVAISVLIALGDQVKDTFKSVESQTTQDSNDSDKSTNDTPGNSSDTNNVPVITP